MARPPDPSIADSRRVLLWMCVIVAVNQLGFGGLIPVLPLYAQSFGVPASAIGSTIAIYGLARVVFAIPGGMLANRYGRRSALAVGGAASSLGNLWCALAQSFPEFLAARFVAGLGAGLVLTTGTVVLADISTPQRRGRMMATYQSVFLFAVGIGPFPGGLLAERFGLTVPFLVYAVAGLLVGLTAWFVVPETRDPAVAARTDDGTRPRASPMQRRRQLLSHPGFVLVGLLGLVSAMARTGGLFAVVPLIAVSKLGLTAGQIGGGFALGSVLGVLSGYPAGAVADRLGRKAVIVPATLLAGLSMAAYCFAPTYGWFVFACVVWGVASAISGATPAAYAADTAPPGMNAEAMSTYRMMADIGYMVGPIALGLMVDLQGGEATLLWTSALVLATGLAFMRFAPETLRGR